VIRIDLRRDDGDVTRLEGVAGLAVMMQTDHLPVVDDADARALMQAVRDMPVVSLRANTSRQLAIMLGTLIASVGEIAGEETVQLACVLSGFVNAANPTLRRVLP